MRSLENLLKIQLRMFSNLYLLLVHIATIIQLTSHPLMPLTQTAKLCSRAQLLGKRLILAKGLVGRCGIPLIPTEVRCKLQPSRVILSIQKVHLADFCCFQSETAINVTVLSIYATKAQPKLLCASLPTKISDKIDSQVA